MAANTFLEMTRSLRLYVPQLPITLAEQFIRDTYRQILERRDWSALRREGEFQLNVMKTAGTVAVTRGATTVTGTSTSFASTDTGRQIKIGQDAPLYTVTYVSSTSLTLDRAYGGDTVTASTYKVFDGYVSAPTDFLRFLYVIDPENGFRLRHWITQDELNAMDPQRLNFGEPYLVVDRMFNTASTPMPQYELWPYASAAKTLYYVYIKRAADLVSDTDIPIWPLRSDVIVQGALAEVAKWPGTIKEPNPYFSRPDLWKAYKAEFEDRMIELERKDMEVYMTGLQYPSYDSYAPMSASWHQTHV